MPLFNCLIHSVLIIRTVRRERCDGISDLVEKRASPRGVIDVFSGQFNRNDLTAPGIDAYV
jgi:hypothetical protein